MLLFDVRLCPTEEEWYDGLMRSGLRRAGKGRLIVQTIALGVAAAMSLTAFFLDGMQFPMSAVVGAVALLLIPVMWFVPQWRMKSMASAAAEEGATAHLWVFEDGVDFGEETPKRAYYRFDEIRIARPTEQSLSSIVLRFKTDEVIVAPKRCLTEEQWHTLTELLGS